VFQEIAISAAYKNLAGTLSSQFRVVSKLNAAALFHLRERFIFLQFAKQKRFPCKQVKLPRCDQIGRKFAIFFWGGGGMTNSPQLIFHTL
jgi:hypothetical protein